MTAKRDLKRRVRERQARTGESYMTALRHVREQRPPAFPVIEMDDLTAAGAALGLRCQIAADPRLRGRIEPARALARLRDVLIATAEDPALELMRAVVLRGESPVRPMGLELIMESRRFLARVRAGVGGVGAGGRMLGLIVDGTGGPETLLCALWLVPHREPMLVISTPEGAALHPLLGWLP